MVDDATVHSLQRHWEDGWNACDLEKIMEPMAQDVVFSSPFVPLILGDPAKTTIDGYDALRASDGTVKIGADSMRVDADGKVCEWRSHYPFSAGEVDAFIQD